MPPLTIAWDFLYQPSVSKMPCRLVYGPIQWVSLLSDNPNLCQFDKKINQHIFQADSVSAKWANQCEVYQTFKKESTLIHYSPFQKTEIEGLLPNLLGIIVPQNLVNGVVREKTQTWQSGAVYPMCAVQSASPLQTPLSPAHWLFEKEKWHDLNASCEQSVLHILAISSLSKGGIEGKDLPLIRSTCSIHNGEIESFPWKQGNKIPTEVPYSQMTQIELSW